MRNLWIIPYSVFYNTQLRTDLALVAVNIFIGFFWKLDHFIWFLFSLFVGFSFRCASLVFGCSGFTFKIRKIGIRILNRTFHIKFWSFNQVLFTTKLTKKICCNFSCFGFFFVKDNDLIFKNHRWKRGSSQKPQFSSENCHFQAI